MMGWRKYQGRNVRRFKKKKGLLWKKEWNKPCSIVLICLFIIMGITCYQTYTSTDVSDYLNKKIAQNYIRGINISPASFKQTTENEYTMNMSTKRKAVSTLLPYLQNAAVKLFQEYKIPVVAVVALNASTGAILAMASRGENPLKHSLPLTLSSLYPAASIFKIVTLSAALEHETIQPDDILKATKRIKYDGKWIQDSSNVHRGQISVGGALAKSCNTAFAAMAVAVGYPHLEEYAARFGFN
ncbi:hypothetical protein HY793_04560, partial [Candidatus Desantisbacteria bacterium]|nr:hypothetical protein [Candidatus Desantisbacteria bacterium]